MGIGIGIGIAAFASDVAQDIVKGWLSDGVDRGARRLLHRQSESQEIAAALEACIAAGVEGLATTLTGAKELNGEQESLRCFFADGNTRELLAPLQDFAPGRIDTSAVVRALRASPGFSDDVAADDAAYREAWDAFRRCFVLRLEKTPDLARAVDRWGRMGALDRREDIHAYLEAVRDDTATLEIRGIASDPSLQRDAGRSYPIVDLYTPLRTRGLDDRWSEARGGAGLAGVLAGAGHVLIEGEPGAGKSTFLQLVAHVFACDRLGERAEDGRTYRESTLGLDARPPAPLPIRVPLARLVPILDKGPGFRLDHELWLLDVLDRVSADNGWRISRQTWRELLDGGEAIVLLDGFDEVADPEHRKTLLRAMRDAKKTWHRCRMVVTTRPVDTGALRDLGFRHVTIAELERRDIEDFLDRWVSALYSGAAERKASEIKAYRVELHDAICTQPGVRRIAHNPVMLTCLCVVHWNEGRLPSGRSRVYKAVVRWLLAARREAREAEGYNDELALHAFQQLALRMMNPAGSKQVVLGMREAAEAIGEEIHRAFPTLPDPVAIRRKAEHWLRCECAASGIVVELPGNELRFWHLTFQEYLAAAALAELDPDEEGETCWWPIVKDKLSESQWRETIDLFPGALYDTARRQVDKLLSRTLALRGPNPTLANDARAAGLVGRLLAQLAFVHYKAAPAVEAAYRDSLRKAEAIFEVDGARAVPLKDRIAVAEALGQGGDPRFQACDRRANLLRVPEMNVALGKYPVTVREYQDFVDLGGYEKERYWDEDGWAERTKGEWREPGGWEKQIDHATRPVTYVSWWQARAYCRWREEMTGIPFRLPTEAEWQQAASPDGRTYPWGGSETEKPDAEQHANFRESGVLEPTPVGLFPGGVAEGGHLDLAGNVWEWCEGVADGTDRALRGGGFVGGAQDLQAAVRFGHPAGYRVRYVGFRVALSPASRWLLDP